MALHEYQCDACGKEFEQITSSTDPDRGRCPKCGKTQSHRLISRFAVGGRGDLRESTMHGCHDCSVDPGHAAGAAESNDHAGHDHGHDHSSD